MRTLLLVCAWLLTMSAAPAWAQDVQAVPTLGARVIDQTGTLSAAQRSALDSKLAAFEQASGPQIVVLLVATSQPEDIASYAQRVADTWKIGRREVGDGVLIVVAKNDRRVRIEVAKALEGAVPDLAARQIIDRAISPAFKAGDFAAGLNAGVDALMARIKGEGLPAPKQRPAQGSSELPWQELAMFFFVAVPVIGGILSSIMGRKLGSLVTAGGAGVVGWLLSTSVVIAGIAGVLALVLVGVFGVGAAGRGLGRGAGRGGPIIWGGGGGGFGGGGGGFGGGGFGSGGGGDFGGGGASGDW
jgi:uncharacterized protein